jgi:hypothetical protein
MVSAGVGIKILTWAKRSKVFTEQSIFVSRRVNPIIQLMGLSVVNLITTGKESPPKYLEIGVSGDTSEIGSKGWGLLSVLQLFILNRVTATKATRASPEKVFLLVIWVNSLASLKIFNHQVGHKLGQLTIRLPKRGNNAAAV